MGKQLLGAHLSISQGLDSAFDKAVALGCNTFQIFTQNAHTWKQRLLDSEQIARFHRKMDQTGIDSIASHTSYLINPASPDKEKFSKSVEGLIQEFIRCSQLKIPFIVLHPGSHMGKGLSWGIDRIAQAINTVFTAFTDPHPQLLLETTAGQGTSIGHTFEQLARILERIHHSQRVGICLDTCHIFAAGYDIATESGYIDTFNQFDRIIGLDRLRSIHLNDAKRQCGCHVDRHEHIGHGRIGEKGFSLIMNDSRFQNIPKIIETPKKGASGQQMDAINLSRLRKLIL